MEDEIIKCSDCGGDMEAGFIPDVTYGGVAQSCWHKGDAKAKKTFRERLRSGSGVKYDPKLMVALTAFRCSQCGLVKLYALSKKTSTVRPVLVGV